ncbi:Type I inositol-1,4,5-trisphosphate 5-phosphatase CVP2 [Hordeum vulgare]|nr:Type I inositol-1,4,5-trisphosphate 5-phosphatase CVP2 [Hordeum vulgare]
MEWSRSISRSPDKGASAHAGTGSSSRRRRRFAGMDSSGRPLGSALAYEECKMKNPQINNECMEKINNECSYMRSSRR